MTLQNPSKHARVAADALARLVTDVQSGRAAWPHPQGLRQTTDDLIRIADHLAATAQQMATALAAAPHTPAHRPHPALTSLHQAGQAAATAASHLRQARRTTH
ncbi:hypothetical protein [Streptomyces cacaoi]|uniref:hypothetical protein n=1 Tax=Streptomyces cacaoi TaxID=1898 RepID=UPI001659D766|nr:hypothetical protein [Streptomyces cacaoi]